MKKSLTEMSLEELWQLFPISLSEHNAEWKKWYEIEEQRLCAILPKKVKRMSHIGSTAIKNIKAKPIIDILVELALDCSMDNTKKVLVANGYTCMSEEKNRISLNMGYTETGFAEQVYHVHIRYDGDHDELYFRDYMNANPSLAQEYERLKCCLCKKYEFNRDAYTEAKGEFIIEHTRKAKHLYRDYYL